MGEAPGADGALAPALEGAPIEGAPIEGAGLEGARLAAGAPEALGPAEAPAEPDGAGVGSVDVTPLGCGEPITSRKFSWAVLVTLAMLARLPPGTLTTMTSPSVTTSASETPALSTRRRMISTAVESWLALTFFPPSALGVRITVAPPLRSRPSLGLSQALPGPRSATAR